MASGNDGLEFSRDGGDGWGFEAWSVTRFRSSRWVLYRIGWPHKKGYTVMFRIKYLSLLLISALLLMGFTPKTASAEIQKQIYVYNTSAQVPVTVTVSWWGQTKTIRPGTMEPYMYNGAPNAVGAMVTAKYVVDGRLRTSQLWVPVTLILTNGWTQYYHAACKFVRISPGIYRLVQTQ